MLCTHSVIAARAAVCWVTNNVHSYKSNLAKMERKMQMQKVTPLSIAQEN